MAFFFHDPRKAGRIVAKTRRIARHEAIRVSEQSLESIRIFTPIMPGKNSAVRDDGLRTVHVHKEMAKVDAVAVMTTAQDLYAQMEVLAANKLACSCGNTDWNQFLYAEAGPDHVNAVCKMLREYLRTHCGPVGGEAPKGAQWVVTAPSPQT